MIMHMKKLNACVFILQAELYTGTLPSVQAVALRGEKLHRVFHNTLDHLVHIMNGYCLPEPFFGTKARIHTDMDAHSISSSNFKLFLECIAFLFSLLVERMG